MARFPAMSGRTYPAGVPSWVDTEQPDVDAAVRFYGGLFGWEFEEALAPGSGGRYAVARLNGNEVGAIGGPGTGPAAWNTYVAVDDADAAVRQLVSLGAALQSVQADSGAGAVRASLTDPEGAAFRLWQAGARPRQGHDRVPRRSTFRAAGISATCIRRTSPRPPPFTLRRSAGSSISWISGR
jgi:uncharacterized protein